MDELRLACRRVLAKPIATLVSVLALACGTASASAAWSLLSAVLLDPLPVERPGRLFVVTEQPKTGGRATTSHTYPVVAAVRQSGVFESTAAGGPGSLLVEYGPIPMQAPVYFATHDFLPTLGIPVVSGRNFSAEDDRRGAPLVAILSYAFWQRAFDGDPGVIGRELTIAKKPATVIGITKQGFKGVNLAQPVDIFLPLHVVADVSAPFTNYFGEAQHQSSPMAWITVVGRAPLATAAEQLQARLASFPTTDRRIPRQLSVASLNSIVVPQLARAAMNHFARLLGITVALLLLIGCGTVGMLLLVRTEARREEFATCLALGASRRRLARGVTIEGALLALAGTALAIPITYWLFRAAGAFQLPGGISVATLDLAIDRQVVLAASVCAVTATAIIAVVAAVVAFPVGIADALRARTGATPRLSRRGARAALVIAQVAVALVLMAAAGVFVRSLAAALDLNPGFQTDRIVTGAISLSQHGYTPERATMFFDELRGRLGGNPAIASVSLTMSRGSYGGAELLVDGVPRTVRSVIFTGIDDRHFSTVGLPISKGRSFSPDDSPRTTPVGIVSESLAKLLADGGDPIGHRITLPYRIPPAPSPVIEIVGVVPDFITRVTNLEPMTLYLPIAQSPATQSRELVIRAASDPDTVRREAIAMIRQLDRAITPSALLTVDERLAAQMGPQRFGMFVLGSLGMVAVLLTILGTYVLTESMSVLRQREMGIRAALGATGGQLGAIVVRETLLLIGCGLTAGLVLSWLGASVIRALLFQVHPLDPLTLGTVACGILALALSVSLRPALRAARVDLSSVLRAE